MDVHRIHSRRQINDKERKNETVVHGIIYYDETVFFSGYGCGKGSRVG